MAKRKYTSHGEAAKRYECTNKKCKWQGKQEEWAERLIEPGHSENVCPKCSNNEFYGLLE